MEAFSHPNLPFLLDSVFLPNTPIKMSGLFEEGDIDTSSFPYYPSMPLQEIPFDVRIHESSDTGPSFTDKQKTDSSSMVLDSEGDYQITEKETPLMEKKRKNSDGSCLSSAQSKEAKAKKQRKCSADKKNQKQVTEDPPTGYIHVRARRGQATDSHSLAERVRREKISERLKMLQGLVPGCDKVTGKALMLDEIINYVQSLQNQVEFLSMKLASFNPMFYDFGVDLDTFMVKPEVQKSTAFADPTTTFTATNNYPLLDSSVSFLLQQGERPNSFSQDNGNLLWDLVEQRQRFTNLSSFQ